MLDNWNEKDIKQKRVVVTLIASNGKYFTEKIIDLLHEKQNVPMAIRDKGEKQMLSSTCKRTLNRSCYYFDYKLFNNSNF